MSKETVKLYDELESFIKENTETFGAEERLIAKLNEYARELRKEGEEKAKGDNLNAVIAAADKARARGFEEGEYKGYQEGYSRARHDEQADKGRVLKQIEELKLSHKREKCDSYNRGRADGANIAQMYEQRADSIQKKFLVETSAAYEKGLNEGWKTGFESGDKYRRSESMGELSNSLRELIKDSIKKHGGDDEKIVSDIEARFTWMMNNAQHVTDGEPTRYRAKWLISLAVMRAIGNAIKSEASVWELADEMLGRVNPRKKFVVADKITAQPSVGIIIDDVIGEALKTKQWNDVKKSLPAYGEPVRVTFDLKDPEGEGKSEYFSVAKLVWHEGADHWEYQSEIRGRYPLTKTSVKGWRYVSHEPVRTTRDRIHWQRMADNQPPLNVWVEAATDAIDGKIQIVRRLYKSNAPDMFHFEYKDGPTLSQGMCRLTQWRYI